MIQKGKITAVLDGGKAVTVTPYGRRKNILLFPLL